MKYKYLPAIAGVTLLVALGVSELFPRRTEVISQAPIKTEVLPVVKDRMTNLNRRLTINDLAQPILATNSSYDIGAPKHTINY